MAGMNAVWSAEELKERMTAMEAQEDGGNPRAQKTSDMVTHVELDPALRVLPARRRV
jgi:hypothetical protein